MTDQDEPRNNEEKSGVIPQESRDPQTDTYKAAADEEHESGLDRLKSRFQRRAITDWSFWIQLGVLIVVAVGTYAAIKNIELLRNSVEEARRSADAAATAVDQSRLALIVDQRPWIQVTSTARIAAGEPVVARLDIRNLGKTPGRVETSILVEVLGRDDAPVVQVQNRYSNRGRIHRLLSSIRGDSERAHHHRSSAF